MRNVHNIHHWTNYRRQIDVFEIADHAKNFREYVVVERDMSPGAHGKDLRKERRVAKGGYYDMTLADTWARPLARSWQKEAAAPNPLSMGSGEKVAIGVGLVAGLAALGYYVSQALGKGVATAVGSATPAPGS